MTTKTCSKCNTDKPLTSFHASKARGTQANCKECRKELDKIYWKQRSANPKKMMQKKAYCSKRKNEIRKLIFEYLSQHACVDCGENDPIVLTFDHVRGKKEYNISDLARSSYNVQTVTQEIEKCEVRCANCHMRKTAKDFNWYTHQYKTSGYS